MIRTPEDAHAYLTAGRAIVTLKSLRSGAHLTFKVRKANKAGTASHFVSVRSASEKGYGYLGFIRGGTKFSLASSARTTFTETSPATLAFKFMIENLARNQMPPSAEIWHEGRCGRCSRALTHPDSIASGIGPECARKIDR